MKFKNLVKGLILENEKANFLYNKYVVKDEGDGKKGPKLPFTILLKLLDGDPTTQFLKPIEEFDEKKDGKNIAKLINVGKYSEWIIDRFIKPKFDDPEHPINVLDRESSQFKSELKIYRTLFLEDLYKLKEDLVKFNRFKDRIPVENRQLNQLSVEKLNDLVKYFSLEKIKTTKSERKEIAKTYEHPGANIVYRDGDWVVAEITDNPLGKDAAIFYGGNDKKPIMGETGWCTSSPGLNYYEGYIKQAPLYVIIPKRPTTFLNYGYPVGLESGLPADRLQFHFTDISQGPQFKDAEDREIKIVTFLKNNPGLKEFFKPKFFNSSSNIFRIDLDKSKLYKIYSQIYGDDDFIQFIPRDIDSLIINNTGSNDVNLNLSDVIGSFKNLETLHLSNCISEVSENICNLKNLTILVLSNNKNLKEIPECLKDLPDLEIINLEGSNQDLIIPPGLAERMVKYGTKMFYKIIHND
jgi:hypothetical protein